MTVRCEVKVKASFREDREPRSLPIILKLAEKSLALVKSKLFQRCDACSIPQGFVENIDKPESQIQKEDTEIGQASLWV